jgi:arsenite methyltransferase
VDASSIPDLSLAECLSLLRRWFDIAAIASRKIDQQAVVEYYRQSDDGYRLFHSNEGALHLAMNRNGRFDVEGYYAQAEFVELHMKECGAQRVLEAGSGNGFNTIYLARRSPGCRFVGVDLTAEHIEASRAAARGIGNVEFVQGNYEQLPCPDESFDVAFGVETFCQTSNLPRALAQMQRALRSRGRLVVIDCFRRRSLDSLDADLQLATLLTEKTTAVDAFTVVSKWLEVATRVRFRVLEARDDSALVVHNLERFYRLARRFFEDRGVAENMLQVFPPLLVQNAICGLLMPFTVGGGVHAYYSLVLERL